MPSLKMIENGKTSTPESCGNAVESGGIDESNSTKEANHSQIVASSAGSNNGNAKEQPVNPLQQIILIIEHKIRNLEKRKNKLESYKSIEKSGKKLTGDQKTAVSKYDECLTSLELTRELCKQFQSIVATANKEAKKEAKRSVFIRAQQENAKIREVLIIQDVLKRFTDATVREDFRQGTNGACKIADSDLLLLEQLCEETLTKRPKTSIEPTFVTAVKQAADHLSAIVDGRNKPFAGATYVNVKTVLTEIQNCGYFDKDIITVEEEEVENAEDKETPVDIEATEPAEDPQEEESLVLAEQTNQPKANTDPSIAPVLSGIDSPSMKVFAEAPAATAVPTPAFPTQPNMVRQVAPNPPSSSVPDVGNAPTLVPPPIHMPTQQMINTNNGLTSTSAPNVHSAAAIIVPTGPVNVPMMQPTATPMPPVPGQQLNATTVQAVENAYFKQHYIQQQQQMRPIHEVIGTGNFFFLQESEIDKPDILPPPVPFGNPLPNTNVTAQQPHPQQVLMGQTTNSSNQLPVDQQGVPAQQATMIAPQPQNVMMGAQHPPTFNNQPFQNLTPSAPKAFNHSMQPQAMETRQISQPMNAVPHSRSPVVSKPTDHGHIPGFATQHTTVVSTQSVAPKEQGPIVVQPVVPDESQNNAQRQAVVQKAQMPQQKPMATQQGSGMNQPFNANLQQYPSLVQNLHDSPNQAVTSNLPGLMVDATADKLKASLNLSDKFPLNQPHLNQQHTKLRHDEWNRGSDFAPSTAKSEDQWSNNPMPRNSATDSGSNTKGQYNLSNHTKPQPASIASESSAPNASGPVVNDTGKRHEQNDNMTSNYGQELQGTHGGSHQAQSTYGHRNNSRSASSSQYQQNNGPNARFDNGMNNSSSTFFKNNERFYQQNQTSNYGTNKSDSSYHQRSTMFKNRNDNNGNNPQTRGAAAYSSTVPSGGTAPPSNNGNNSGNFGSGIDYRSNARPVNSTRNTGPPSSRPHQRNHSGNSYGGPRGGSNSRAPQSSINA